MVKRDYPEIILIVNRMFRMDAGGSIWKKTNYCLVYWMIKVKRKDIHQIKLKKKQNKHYIYVLKRTQRLNKAMACSLSLNLSWIIGAVILV